jgi:hypothetical protein
MTQAASSSSYSPPRPWIARLGAGGLVAVESAALVAVTAFWAGASVLGGAKPAPWAVGASGAILLATLATLGWLHGVRALAFQTFWQCIRMKMAVAFIVLLAAALAALREVMTGDGTLAGAIRSLLAYGTGATELALSVMTVLLSSHVVANDVRRRQVFLTVTKPLARWEYVLGRWLGIVLLDAALLAMAMGAVYVLAQHLRHNPEQLPQLRGQAAQLSAEDRRAVESEIFTARARVYPDPVDLAGDIQKRLDRLKKDPREYDAVLEDYKTRTRGDAEKAMSLLTEELEKQVAAEKFSTGPGGRMAWSFSGIQSTGTEVEMPGVIAGVRADAGEARIRVDSARAAAILFGTPLRVDDVDGRVTRVEPNAVIVQFGEAGLSNLGQDPVGREVSLRIDPILQLTYKASVTGGRGDAENLPGLWLIQNPLTHGQDSIIRFDPVDRPNTIAMSSRAVSSDGRLDVEFYNRRLDPRAGFVPNQLSVRIDPRDIYVLYRQGSFEWNFLRGAILILVQLAFLAALGVLAGSFLSFPVAVLLCLVLLLFSLMRSFVADMVTGGSLAAPGVNVFDAAAYLVFRFVGVLLPDFAGTSPSDSLVDGLRVGWQTLGETASVSVGIRTMLYLALGCFIFKRRELARVQV